MVAVEVGQGEMDGVEPTTAKEKGTWETFMELEGIEDPKKKRKKKKKVPLPPCTAPNAAQHHAMHRAATHRTATPHRALHYTALRCTALRCASQPTPPPSFTTTARRGFFRRS